MKWQTTTATLALAGLLLSGCYAMKANLDPAGTRVDWDAEGALACQTRYRMTPGTGEYDLCLEVMKLKHMARHIDSQQSVSGVMRYTNDCDPDLGGKCD